MRTDSFNELASDEFQKAHQDDDLGLWNACVKECLASSSFHEAWRAGQSPSTSFLDRDMWKVLTECFDTTKPGHDPVEGLLRLYARFLSYDAARRFKSKL
jgi:hypothetical protein